MEDVPFAPLLIDGERRPASTGATFSVHSPYTGDLASTAAAASSDDCRAAIQAAQRAFPTWEATPYATRQEILFRAAATIASEEWQRKAARWMRAEIAMPQEHIQFNFMAGPMLLKGIACMVNELKGETFPSVIPGGQVFVQRRAQGVIYSVVPWNAPIPLVLTAVAVPLVCGNTALIVDALHDAGLPAGVVNFVPMSVQSTPALTAEIIAHTAVRKVTFTGSDRVGRILAIEAAKHLKPCVLELGGKAPSVVLADADIEQASRAIVSGGFFYSGQICMATERVIVQRSVLEPLVSAIKSHLSTLTVGDPEHSNLSALFSERSADGIVAMIKEAKDAGAEVLLGDAEKAGPALLKPHILLGVKRETRLWQRESFGPVLVVAVVDSVDEAIELANASEYSLVAALWTRDVYNAMDIARRIHSGSVNINGSTIHAEGTLGLSGLGGSSGYGRFDVNNFTDKRVITLHPPIANYAFGL
ncbi:aldehyde dehydrogenase [Russula earlei]|uniref:Aldehyde dehydrogenase n=1 Tax=Russula earlei TaxID=71964 RepID=A0ACC0TV26_9AGAM|nr:aldehyde dehydrogenase [Russula earlei]